jgi:hypothetical protein
VVDVLVVCWGWRLIANYRRGRARAELALVGASARTAAQEPASTTDQVSVAGADEPEPDRGVPSHDVATPPMEQPALFDIEAIEPAEPVEGSAPVETLEPVEASAPVETLEAAEPVETLEPEPIPLPPVPAAETLEPVETLEPAPIPLPPVPAAEPADPEPVPPVPKPIPPLVSDALLARLTHMRDSPGAWVARQIVPDPAITTPPPQDEEEGPIPDPLG